MLMSQKSSCLKKILMSQNSSWLKKSSCLKILYLSIFFSLTQLCLWHAFMLRYLKIGGATEVKKKTIFIFSKINFWRKKKLKNEIIFFQLLCCCPFLFQKPPTAYYNRVALYFLLHLFFFLGGGRGQEEILRIPLMSFVHWCFISLYEGRVLLEHPLPKNEGGCSRSPFISYRKKNVKIFPLRGKEGGGVLEETLLILFLFFWERFEFLSFTPLTDLAFWLLWYSYWFRKLPQISYWSFREYLGNSRNKI